MVILAVLAILWAGVIGSWLRERAHAHQGDSTLAFRQQLSTLQRTQPGAPRGAVARPRSAQTAGSREAASNRRSLAQSEMRRRRRDVLFALFIVAGITFVAAAISGSAALIGLNVVCDLVAAGYVVALVQQQRLATEQQVKVRYLPNTAASVRPARAARPSAVAVGQQLTQRPVRRTQLNADAALLRRSATN